MDNMILGSDVLLMLLVFWHEKHSPSIIGKRETRELLLSHNIEVLVAVRQNKLEDDLVYVNRFGIWVLELVYGLS